MITPCIHFQGNCDEAISFYKEALGVEVKITFDKLADRGNVTEPLSETFLAGLFGEVIDRFGVTWQVMIEQE